MKLSKQQQQQWRDLFSMSQDEVIDFVQDELIKNGYTIVSNDDAGLVAYHGKEPQESVMVVAHADTINTHRAPNVTEKMTLEFIEDENEALAIQLSQQDILNGYKCLGADDRSGIMTILRLLDSWLTPHVVIPRDEEIGCVGSTKMVKNARLKQLYATTYFVLQIDRGRHEGKLNEYVTYGIFLPKPIENEIEKYFELATGSYSDVAELAPELDVPGLNVSASYEYEHTIEETLYLNAFQNNLYAISSIIDGFDYSTRYPYENEFYMGMYLDDDYYGEYTDYI